MTNSITITPESFETKVNGNVLVVDPGKMHETWIVAALEYGLRRYANDKFSGEKGQTKFELVRAFYAEMMNGKEMPEKTRRSVAPIDPVGALASKNAKADLLAVMKNLTKVGNIKAIYEAGDDKVKAYFTVNDNGPVWNEESVKAFIAKQAAGGGRDYKKEAEQTLSVAL